MEKMRVYYIILTIAIMSSCNKENAPDCFQISGNRITVPIEIPQPFNTIEIHDNIKLVLSNSEDQDVITITGGENLINEIEFDISDGSLSISNENTCNWVREYETFLVEISSNEISEIVNYGHSGVELDNYITSNFKFNQWNSLADNTFIIDADTIEINLHTNAGTASISGAAHHSSLYANGVSRIFTPDFSTYSASVNNSGRNDVLISVSHNLFAFIGSEGNIIYNDSSINLVEDINGSGSVFYQDF